MKKVIFNKKEEIEEWISVDEPRFRYTTIMSALKWGHDIYKTREFIVDIEEGTISIDVKPKIDTTKELLWDEGLGEL
jgi:hypothetical protein